MNNRHPEAFLGQPEKPIHHHIKLLHLTESDGVWLPTPEVNLNLYF